MQLQYSLHTFQTADAARAFLKENGYSPLGLNGVWADKDERHAQAFHNHAGTWTVAKYDPETANKSYLNA